MNKLKILLADSNRDFLTSFKKLLELSGHEVICAFDGTQVIQKLHEQNSDIVILENDIPRIAGKIIISQLNSSDIPVISILSSKINSDILLSDTLSNAYISLPFFPSELEELVTQVTDKKKKGQKTVYEDIEIDEASFRLCDKLRVTNEEINVIKALIDKEDINSRKSWPYISSLNNKLTKLNKKNRIRYVMQEGYRLVTDNE